MKTTLSDLLYQRQEGWDNQLGITLNDYLYMLETLKDFKKTQPEAYGMFGVWGTAIQAGLREFMQYILYPYLDGLKIEAALKRIKRELEK